MQRAAASTPASSPQTPEVPSSKRQKLSSTSSSTFTPLSELEVIQRALKVEEDKRLGAVDKLAAEAGETKWVLSVADRVKEGKGLLVLNTGYSEIDCGNMNDVGRRSFGMFNRELEVYSLKSFEI